MKLKREWVFSWVVLRLPLLGLVLFFLRYQLVELFESMIGFMGRMDFFVFTASTFTTRFLLYLVSAIGLGLWFWLLERSKISPRVQYVVFLAGAFIGIYFSFVYLFLVENAINKTVAIIVLLALNTLPHEWLTKPLVSGTWSNLVFLAGIGVVEAILPQSYALWLMNIGQTRGSLKRCAWLGGILIAPLLWIFLLVPYDNQRVFTLAERLHSDPAVEKFAPGIYNWVELNPEHDLLYVVGRGTNFLLAFDVNHLDQPPIRSREDIGKTQSFGFNPDLQEIYVYKAHTKELLYIDALTLDVTRSVPVPDLAPGDVWIRWLRLNDTIILSSEADAEIGIPVYAFDRESGSILESMPYPVYPTELAFNSSKPLMYFSSFKKPYLAIWDMEPYEITKQIEIESRTDRMTFSEKYNEVWLAAPLDGAVLRFDADMLNTTGSIKTRIGIRTLTIDTQRNLLLVGNFMNNRLDVINPDTNERINSFYLGPWIRTIALDMESGIAYVSTVRGLFKVNYAQTSK